LRLTSIGDRGISRLPRQETIEGLDLALTTQVTADGLLALRRLPQLKNLSLRPGTTTPDSLRVIASLPRLERLYFDANRIGHAQDQLPHSSPVYPDLGPGFGATDLATLTQQIPLKHLSLDGFGFGDEVMPILALNTHFETLGLGDSPITDGGLLQLRHNAGLRYINVEGTRISREAALQFQQDFAPRCAFSDNWCCGCLSIEAPREE
ncbi:MAG: hypothetical protein KDA58_10855, partial [Planctomycetaceae bacterium]|nr:hypothetical protein [Planctomycetaceae bacterium]